MAVRFLPRRRVDLKETHDSQTNRLPRDSHDFVRGGQPPDMNTLRYRQMQGIQCSQWESAEPRDEIQRRDQVIVCDRVNLKKPGANVILKGCKHARLDSLCQFARASAPGKQTAELDNRQTADGRRGCA